jgi:hypothetical protein
MGVCRGEAAQDAPLHAKGLVQYIAPNRLEPGLTQTWAVTGSLDIPGSAGGEGQFFEESTRASESTCFLPPQSVRVSPRSGLES